MASQFSSFATPSRAHAIFRFPSISPSTAFTFLSASPLSPLPCWPSQSSTSSPNPSLLSLVAHFPYFSSSFSQFLKNIRARPESLTLRWISSISKSKELTPEAVGTKPGNILVPVSNQFNLYHLSNVLDRIKPGRRDVVVLHVRILRRAASGEQELDADQLFGSIEQHLFSQALSLAEKRGKSIRLAVVASNDLWDGILRAGQS